MAFCEGFMLRKFEGENYVVDIRCEKDYIKPLRLNDIASEMFELLKKGKSVEEVARVISAECDVPFEMVINDCVIFLDELENNGICRKNDL